MKKRQEACAALIAALAWGIGEISPAQVPQGIFTELRNTGFEAGINTPFFEYQPVVSPDGKELYFATGDAVDAERASSLQGGEDMWVATRESLDEPFGDVKNLQHEDLAAPGIILNSWSTENPGSISHDLHELYFGSYRDGTADIFVAWRAEPGAPFERVIKLGTRVNAPDMNEGSPRISSDGLKLYYHRNVQSPQPDVFIGQSDVWIVTRESTEDVFWDQGGPDPVPLEVNSGIYDEFRPAISTDGLTLFFSDWVWNVPRRGDPDQGDIWVTTRSSVEDLFSEPVNLNILWPGSQVNSDGLETQVSISADWPAYGSKIYFASNRPGTLAGEWDLDIWEATWVPREDFLRGDANVDGTANLSDAIFVLASLFLGGETPSCDKAADTNDDGQLDISDPVFLLGYLFLGSKAPSEPLASCGADPTEDALSCESFARCP